MMGSGIVTTGRTRRRERTTERQAVNGKTYHVTVAYSFVT